MTTKEVNFVPPEQDERVHEILTRLMKGDTREEIAISLKQKSYKSLDIYMRRKGYRYDTRLKTYVANVEPSKITLDGSKASRIVQLLAEYIDDPTIICQKAGFKNMEEIAQFMTSKNYRWNPSLQNYEKCTKLEERPNAADINVSIEESNNLKSISTTDTWQQYLPLLNLLQNNEEKLIELLMPYGNGQAMPRYLLEGIAKPKTVQMVHSLGNLVIEFAEQKNVSQREVFEVALIEFFRKYGFEREVERVLS